MLHLTYNAYLMELIVFLSAVDGHDYIQEVRDELLKIRRSVGEGALMRAESGKHQFPDMEICLSFFFFILSEELS